MLWSKSSLTKPNETQKDLEKLIQERSTILTYPAKKVFLEPGMILDGVYYVASGRTCHYMMSLDGTDSIYTGSRLVLWRNALFFVRTHRFVFKNRGKKCSL